VEGLCHVVMQLHGRLRAEARRAEELEAQRLLLLGRLEGAARAAHGARGPEGPPTQYELFVLERPALLDMRHLAALEAAAHAAEERRREELFWQWMADVLRAAEPAPGPAGAAAGARGSLPGGCDTEIDGAGLQEFQESLGPLQRALEAGFLGGDPDWSWLQDQYEAARSADASFQDDFLAFLRRHWEGRKQRLPPEAQRSLKGRLRAAGAALDGALPSPWLA
ncbi:unnamed protein product, partial [Prorocentrum cordatum]